MNHLITLAEAVFKHVTDVGDEIEVVHQHTDGVTTKVKITREGQSLSLPVASINSWAWLLEQTKELLKPGSQSGSRPMDRGYPEQLVSAARSFSVCPCPSNLATLKDALDDWSKK